MSKPKTIAILIIFWGLLLASTGAKSQVIVKIKPKPPKVKVVKPARPGPAHIWVDGHWKWNKAKGEYVWIKGHWIKAKRGKAWQAGHWESIPSGFKWIPGKWVPAGKKPKVRGPKHKPHPKRR